MTFPISFFNQPTNSGTVSSATTVYLSASSNLYQSIATTALGQSVIEEDATKLPVLDQIRSVTRVIKNDGGYPIAYRDNTGVLIMAIAPGGVLYATLKDNSTPAGSWSVTGTNLEPGIISVDNTFSSTYTSTVLAQFVALDNNTSIHFAALASGFAAFVVDNFGKVVSTPVTVDATASSVPRMAFKIDATHAAVFYGSNTAVLIGVVLTLTSSSPTFSLSVGTPSSTLSALGAGVEDFINAPKIAQLDTNLFLVSYATATGAGTTSVAAFQVSASTTMTLGSAVNIIAANNCLNSTQTYKLTTTTAAVSYKSGAAAPFANSAVVVSVTNANPPVCTVATPAAATNCQTSQVTACSSALLSSTKLAIADDNNTTQVTVSGFTFSGTTTTAWTALNVETGLATNLVQFTTNSATRYNPHLWLLSAGTTNTVGLWYFDASSVSRTLVISENGGTVTAGQIVYQTISANTSGSAGSGVILAQGTSEFMTVKLQMGATIGYGNGLMVNKISGTTVTWGQTKALRTIGQDTSVIAARLSSGDYVITGDVPNGFNAISVVRSNGDAINYRGDITCPAVQNTVMRNNPGVVTNNRLVLTGNTTNIGTTAGVATLQLRLLNVEIAQ